tara:strand:+ start:164 stop:340 length:177 start_codon:yes stop_codon:yes gene_type:complete
MVSHLINPNPNHNFDLIGILDTKDKNKIDLSGYNFKKYISKNSWESFIEWKKLINSFS